MRRVVIVCAIAVSLIAAVSSCSKKADNLASQTSSDSLLASNPVEQPQGNLTPQTQYQPPQEQKNEPPAPAPTPRAKKPARSHTSTPAASTPSSSSQSSSSSGDKGVMLEAGTPIDVTVQTQISTETAHAGDTWTGLVKENVIVGDRVVIPAGSTVTGEVVSAIPAGQQKGTKATLDLAVKSVDVNGTSHPVSAGTESIVAGSPRARNLGAIAGSAAAGALIGKAVGGSGKGALIGGLIGGAAATGVVAASKGYQVVIKEGTVIKFSVSQNTHVSS